MTNETKNILIGLAFGIAGISTAGMVYSTLQTRSIRRMVIGSTERIAQMSQIDIDHKMVDQMVQKAVRDQAGTVTRAAADKVSNEVLADLRNRVKQAVSNQASSINKQVAKTIADEMMDVNKDDIVDEVIEATTERLVEKLGDELDSEVGKLGKIYQGIAAALR